MVSKVCAVQRKGTGVPTEVPGGSKGKEKQDLLLLSPPKSSHWVRLRGRGVTQEKEGEARRPHRVMARRRTRFKGEVEIYLPGRPA